MDSGGDALNLRHSRLTDSDFEQTEARDQIEQLLLRAISTKLLRKSESRRVATTDLASLVHKSSAILPLLYIVENNSQYCSSAVFS